MAISGFNMALVIAIFTAFFTALGLPTRWVAFLMMGLVVFYMALVGWPPSATRAGLMSLVALLGWALNREVLSLNTVAISAFLILLVSPMQLFMPGFQLSYVVVLALVFWVNPLYQKMKELLFKSSSPHPVIATFILATCVSCIAWLSVLPITLCTFGTFALYSIFANLIIAGIVTLLTSLGIVALGVNLLNVNWGIYFNEVNEMLMEGLLGVLRLFQMLPGAYWEITPLPNFILIIYYFILLYFLYDKIKLRT
jgi:competence protein ComEC